MNCYDTIDHILSNDHKERSISKLDEHLQACPRCRSLVEVISPMLNASLVTESNDERVSVPTWSPQELTGGESEIAIEFAQKSAMRLALATKTQGESKLSQLISRESRFMNKLKFAAAFLAGVAASFGGIAVLRSESVPNESHMNSTCLLGSDFDDSTSSEKLVRSCMACHIASN